MSGVRCEYRRRLCLYDHSTRTGGVLPLAESWDSGASTWPAARREAYANDQESATSLAAVTARTNRSKADQDPAQRLPPAAEVHCRYVAEWVATKLRWNLTADETEWQRCARRRAAVRTRAHKTFTKGRSATQEEPVYELYRNGIVHGSILNYDNITVATKAFNRLLAVADWAFAREKEQQHQDEEPPTWSSVGRQLQGLLDRAMEQAELDRANKQWRRVQHLPDSETFTSHPAYNVTHQLLTCWKSGNYGSLSDLVTHDLHTKHGKAIRSAIRRAYEPYPLTAFEISSIRHDMAVACTVTVVLDQSDGRRVAAELRWVRENDEADPRPEPWPGQWRLVVEPCHFLARATSLPPR